MTQGTCGLIAEGGERAQLGLRQSSVVTSVSRGFSITIYSDSDGNTPLAAYLSSSWTVDHHICRLLLSAGSDTSAIKSLF